MKPAASIILFTTVSGAAQGMVVALAVAALAGAPARGTGTLLAAATLMLLVALAASFFHLGHWLRAWRAVLMWRTSWMSREVIVLPAFIALTAAWAMLAAQGVAGGAWLPLLAIAGSVLLWVCTAMIYVCIRFIQEWAHPLTIVNYVLIGLSSGLVTAGAFAVLVGDAGFARALAPWAIAATAAAWAMRALALRRNARLVLKSSVQSATGIRSPQVVQKSMGFTGGSFNTREFFHGASAKAIRGVKLGFQLLAFAVPLVLLFFAASGADAAWLLAAPVQFAGVLAERWFFFAQARHPQNIYYQVVS